MLDSLGVLFSTMAVLFVVWRAAKLDDVYPWFDHVSASKVDPESGNDGRRTADALGGQRQAR